MKTLFAFALTLAFVGCSSSKKMMQRSEKFFRPLSTAEIQKLHNKGRSMAPVTKDQFTLSARTDQTKPTSSLDQLRFKAEADSLRQVVSKLERNLLIAQNDNLELKLKIAQSTINAASRTDGNMAERSARIPETIGGNDRPLTLRKESPGLDDDKSGANNQSSVELASVERRLTTPAEQYSKALSLFNQRQYRNSIQLLGHVQNVTTDKDLSARSKYWTGENYFGLAEYAKALKQFEMVEASGLQGKQADAYWMAGRCHEKMREFALARQCFERLVREFPSSRLASFARRKLEAPAYRTPKQSSDPDQTTV